VLSARRSLHVLDSVLPHGAANLGKGLVGFC